MRAANGPRFTRGFDGEWLIYTCYECGHVRKVRPFDYERRPFRDRMNDSIDRVLGIGPRR